MVFKIRKAATDRIRLPTAEVVDAGEFSRGLHQAERPATPDEVYPPAAEPQPSDAYPAYSTVAEEAPVLREYEAPRVEQQLTQPQAESYSGYSDTIDMPAASPVSGTASQYEFDQAQPEALVEQAAATDTSDLYSAEPIDLAPPAKRKGLFGLKRTEPTARTAQRATPARPKRKKSAPAPRSVILQIAMRDLHGTYLQITDDSVAPLDGNVEQSIRVSELDHHLALPGKRSHRAAMDHAVSTLGAQATLLFPDDKGDATFFAAPLDEIRAVDHPCSPAQAVVVNLLQQRFSATAGCVAALSLIDRASQATTLLLFHRADTGLVREPYVVLRSDDLQMDLDSFYENRQVPLADRERLAVFTNDDLLSAAAGLRTYPRDRTFGGIGASSLLGLVGAAALAVTVGSAGYAGTVYLSWQQADSALRAEKSKNARLSADLSRLIEGSVKSYAKLANLNVLPSLELLEQLHSAGSIGSVKLDRTSGTVLEYTLPLNKAGSSSNATSNSLTSTETVAAFKAKPAPEGCSKSALALTEGGNVLKASFVCQVDGGNFGRHRLD